MVLTKKYKDLFNKSAVFYNSQASFSRKKLLAGLTVKKRSFAGGCYLKNICNNEI